MLFADLWYLSLSFSLFFSLFLHLFFFVTVRYILFDALYEIFFSWLNLPFFHAKAYHNLYKFHQPFTDYLLRLPYLEILEKRVFRSRTNRRLVEFCSFSFTLPDNYASDPLLWRWRGSSDYAADTLNIIESEGSWGGWPYKTGMVPWAGCCLSLCRPRGRKQQILQLRRQKKEMWNNAEMW